MKDFKFNTRTITTKLAKAEVVLREQLSAGRIKQIRNFINSRIDYNFEVKGDSTSQDIKNQEQEQKNSFKLSGNDLIEHTNVKLRTIVVSIDGEATQLIQRLDELPADDYDQIVDEVEAIVDNHEKKVGK